MNFLLSWVGDTDLNSVSVDKENEGPIKCFLNSEYYFKMDKIFLLTDDHRPDELEKYREDLKKFTKVKFIDIKLNDPTDYTEIYPLIEENISNLSKKYSDIFWNFFISPGTSQMAAIWIILGLGKYNANIFQSFKDPVTGKVSLKQVKVPFSIDYKYIEKRLENIKENEEILQNSNYIKNIQYKSEVMKKLLSQALKVAKYNVPVLILGETGTGKELLANFIMENSSAKDKFSLNMAHLSKELARSELFGYSRGAFTGATKNKDGYFKKFKDGILFFDEIGELDLDVQAELLRVLESKEFYPIGSSTAIKTNTRIIAATNRDLYKMVKEGKFREDLFYRLSTIILRMPPLRERQEDIETIANYFVKKINNDFTEQDPNYQTKSLTDDAIALLREYSWPGNVRQLYQVLLRCFIWVDEEKITSSHIKEQLCEDTMNPNINKKCDRYNYNMPLPEYLEMIEKKYIEETLKTSKTIKEVTEKLRYNNYQTLQNRIEKYELKPKD